MLLGIETSTKNCSIALFKDAIKLGANDERGDRFVHGERLHVMIQELLHKYGAAPKDLSGIIVGEGPGSYTGLRIGSSAAKGLAFALNIPMYAVPTLGCFDFTSFESNYCISVLDARRDEVFAQVWKHAPGGFEASGAIEAVIVDNQSWNHLRGESVTIIGDCAEKMTELLSPLPKHWTIAPTTFPSASAMHAFMGPNLASVDTAYFEPFYLKDFVAEKSKKKYL